jgi:mannose-1-phosphate guanylyltransferase/mannose-6-phosphate isomerase
MTSITKKTFCPLIICGGVGKRLWPISRSSYPKQFIKIGDYSLFQTTVFRLMKVFENNKNVITKIFIVSNKEYEHIITDQLKEIKLFNQCYLIFEPLSKNTAPAIICASLIAQKLFSNPNLLVVPSDAYIKNDNEFKTMIIKSHNHYDKNSVIFYGVKPVYPEPGFGYISVFKKGNTLRPKSFIEKPSLKNAEVLQRSKNNFWNIGIFGFTAFSFNEILLKFSNLMYENCLNVVASSHFEINKAILNEQKYKKIKSNSIDFEIMEKLSKKELSNSVFYELKTFWSDVGTIDSFLELQLDSVNSKDIFENNSKNNIIYTSSSSKLIATESIEDLVIIDQQDALLVYKKGNSQNIKNLVNKIEKIKPEIIKNGIYAERPWGKFEVIIESADFKVKKIIVNPKSSLSLQKHKNRSEHWIVISGVADVTCGSKMLKLKKNQSTFIPRGTKHQLANSSSKKLEIIEVQTGNYLGEDDIIRYSDIYGR